MNSAIALPTDLSPVLPTSLPFAAAAVLLLPLLSFVLHASVLRHHPKWHVGWVAVILQGGAHLAAWWVALLGFPLAPLAAEPALAAFDITWLTFNSGWRISMGFLIDGLSLMMILVVTGISTAVHTYSVAYMRDDGARSRFFALLSFFTFAMLGLVVATNAAQTFIFWELVGAASYLLIGFWYHKPEAVAASKKAFVINRFADVFFLAGILLVAGAAQSFEFARINAPQTAQALSHTLNFFPNLWGFEVQAVTAVALLLFIGAWAKSAMFPMHVWLPDAMEGPTPVSSLIHSATMVVAGIYLVARLFPFLSASPDVLLLIEVTGVFTALFAAIIACTQTDIKRILAFSTLSQLGYMMFALGLGGSDAIGRFAFSASQFHVFTHAFFKCLLFLSAGVIIHAAHSQELGDTGGLRRRLPVTYALTLIGCLALAGMPPLAGFFSKDAILIAAFSRHHYFTFTLALVTGGLTAFYMFRYFITIFHGPLSESHAHPNRRNEGLVVLVPMALLALLSLASGFLEHAFFARVHLPQPSDFAVDHALENVAWLPWVATLVALAGIVTAVWRYGLQRIATGLEPDSSLWHRAVFAKLHVDAVWNFAAQRLLIGGVGGAVRRFEAAVVNGLYPAVAWALQVASLLWALIQNGRISWYAGFGVVGFCLAFWFGGLAWP